MRAHATIVRELDAELRAAHALGLTSYEVLLQVSLAEGASVQMSELADAVMLSRSGLTRLVERLERDGLMERRRGSRDPRQTFAAITPGGLEKLNEATPTHLAGVRRHFLGHLGKKQGKGLVGLWEALLAPPGDGPDH